jgi:beta-N-acetylhexosaminidase
VEAGLEAIMTAHIMLPQIDAERPVTLSRVLLRGLLRESMGFDGVVMTDGISMGAISGNYGLSETLAEAFNAGVDIVLVHSRYDVVEVLDTVEQLLEAGRIDEAAMSRSLHRILRLKARYGLLADTVVD